MIRPWYCSRLCWLGVPTFLFLLWAWANSNFRHYRLHLSDFDLNSTQGKLLWWAAQSDVDHDITLDPRTTEVTVETHQPSELFFASCVFVSPRMLESHPVDPGERCWFPAPEWRSVDINADTYYRLISVPYWLLSASYSGFWMGGLIWWQRRKLRLLKSQAALPR